MARGKHGQRAALRREDAAVQSEIDTYKRNVKRLTEHNRELQDKLKKSQESHGNDVRILKAQLAEGLSPELIILRKQLDIQSERASAAEQRYAELDRKWQIASSRLLDALVDTFGISGTEAIEFGVNTIFRQEDDPSSIVVESNSTNNTSARRLGATAAARIAAARGERRRGATPLHESAATAGGEGK